MYSNRTAPDIHSVLSAAAIAFTLLAGNASAAGHPVTVAVKVDSRGLDLETTAGAHQFYLRVKSAARIVCTHADQVGLEPSPDPEACSETALSEAIKSARIPQLTQIYLETHTSREASAHGIGIPLRVAGH